MSASNAKAKNDGFAERCRCAMNAVNVLSRLGVVVRKIDLDAMPLPQVWVYCAPALYRAIGDIDDLGQAGDSRLKSAQCLGCEVRWQEPVALLWAKEAAGRLKSSGGRHA